MIGVCRKFVNYSFARIYSQSFQQGKFAISDVICLRLRSSSTVVHPSAAVGSAQASRDGAVVGGFPLDGNCGTGLLVDNCVFSRNFTSSAQVYRMKRYDEEDDVIMDRHFNNPLNKYLDDDESLQKSLEDIAREQKRKIQAAKYSSAARDFKQAPEKRTLSWDTIQQIHYLRQENPEEWSIASLAESFNVSEEVIVKVLKSKFRPSEKARCKQDLAAAENTGYVQTGSTGEARTQALVASGAVDRPMKKDRKERQDKASKDVHLFKSEQRSQRKENHDRSSAALNRFQHNTEQEQNTMSSRRDQEENKSLYSSRKRGDEAEELKEAEIDFSFGNIDFENVDSLMGQVKLKPQVFRKGRNFYNEHGEFLYRI